MGPVPFYRGPLLSRSSPFIAIALELDLSPFYGGPPFMAYLLLSRPVVGPR